MKGDFAPFLHVISSVLTRGKRSLGVYENITSNRKSKRMTGDKMFLGEYVINFYN